MARLSATNYDPHQISEQWKDRVHREEWSLIFKRPPRPLTGSTAPSALDVCDLRLQNLHYNLKEFARTPSVSTKTPSAATRSQNGGSVRGLGSSRASAAGSVKSAASRRSAGSQAGTIRAAARDDLLPVVTENENSGSAEKTSAAKNLRQDLDRERKLRRLAEEEASMLRAIAEERSLATA